jgi:hypothetical protein
MTELGQFLSTEAIRDLVTDIIECIENPEGQSPRVTKVAEGIAILEIDGYKFRLEIHDMNEFQ